MPEQGSKFPEVKYILMYIYLVRKGFIWERYLVHYIFLCMITLMHTHTHILSLPDHIYSQK